MGGKKRSSPLRGLRHIHHLFERERAKKEQKWRVAAVATKKRRRRRGTRWQSKRCVDPQRSLLAVQRVRGAQQVRLSHPPHWSRRLWDCLCCREFGHSRGSCYKEKLGNAFDNRIDAKRSLRKIKLLCHMDHENVIDIKDIIRPPKKDVFNDVYIAYELMDTDLHQIIRSDQPLTDDHCQYFLYQILRGLKYVHSASVLHRDFKRSNLLLNANCDPKIGDFGLARTTSETDFMTEYVVTRWYREYTAAIDVWSVGCILGEIMTKEPLFPGRDYVHQLRLITELIGSPDDASLGFLRSDNARRYVRQLPKFRKQNFLTRFTNVSAGAVDLLERMLVFDPDKCLTIEDALSHPFLSALHDINDEPVCSTPFHFDFEHPSCTEEHIKELIWRESVRFNPEPVH